MPASASAGAPGNVLHRAGRREGRPHLSLQLSRRRPRDAGGSSSIANSAALKKAERRCSSSAHGALGAAGRRGGARWRPRRRSTSAWSRTAGTAFPCCTPPRRCVGALDLGLVPGDRRQERRADGRGRRARRAVPARRRRGRGQARAVRRLYRHPWRPRRPPRRRHPARRRLSGKIRALRQHRRPRADGRARRVPARRRARGLGDPARALGRARLHAAL